MGTNNIIFLEVIEWFDETGQELIHRIPENGSGEIKFGAQLVVRDSQAGILFYKGKATEAFGPGRHTLKTANIPVLTKILSAPWGMTSPLRAEVYFANMKVFPNLKWGTKNPVAFKDSELGLIRLRAHGIFNIQIIQPILFINSLVGTMGKFTTEEIEEYLKRIIVSRFNDYLGENLDSILNLASHYDELSTALQERLHKDFTRFGLNLERLYITSITPPPDVQKAIDDQSRMNAIQDLDKFVKMKAAMAMEKAAESQGEAGAGIGMGMGFMMPGMFAQSFTQQQPTIGNVPQAQTSPSSGAAGVTIPSKQENNCPDCHNPIPVDSKFCPLCGHQQLVFDQCVNCGKNLAPNAKFCSQCGHPSDEKPAPATCSKCGQENMPGASFCNQCGEKLV
jgi:membrane protease subunit (stomatin/prohibitin family)